MPSLSVLIGVTTAVTVLVVASITLSVTLTYSFDALHDVGSKHAKALLDAATYRCSEFLDEANGASRAVQQHFISGNHGFPTEDPTDATLMAQASMMLATFRASRHVYQVTMFGIDGGFTPVIVHPKDDQHVLQENNIVRGSKVVMHTQSWWASDGTASPSALSTGFSPLDVRPLFGPGVSFGVLRGIIGNSTSCFMVGMSLSVYFSAGVTLQVMQIPFARNVWNASGTYMGAAWGSISTQWFTSFLMGVKSTPGAQLFVLDPTQRLISSTHPANISTMTTVPKGTVPAAGCFSTETTSTLLFGGPVFLSCFASLATYEWAPANQLAAAGLPAYNDVRYMQLGGDAWFVARSKMMPADTFGFYLELLVMLPETDVLGSVYQGRNVAIGVTVAVFVVATAASVAIVVLLLSPLNGVAERMHLAASFQDDDKSREVSSVTEVGQLQSSYYELNDELRRLAAFVPASVLAGRYAEDDQEADEQLRAAMGAGNLSSTPDAQRSESVRSRSMASHHSGSKRSSTHAATALNVTLGLSERPCTVIAANCRDFHAFLRSKSTSVIVSSYVSFMEGVVGIVQSNHGVLDSFHGDQLLISFNGARQIGMHTRRAANAAFALTSSIQGTLGLNVHVGFCSGRALVGNVGSETSRRFSILGTIVTRAAALARLGAQYCHAAPLRAVEGKREALIPEGCIVLTPASTSVDLANFRLEPLDLVRLPQKDKPEVIQRLVSPIDESQGEEWLYVVGGGNNDNGAAEPTLEALVERAFQEAHREVWDAARSTCAAANRLAAERGNAPAQLVRITAAIAAHD